MNSINIKTLGADPEFFLLREGEFYPSCGIIGGTKENPKPLIESGIPGLSIQEDNVAVEITTAAWDTRQGYVDNLTNSLAYLPATFPEEFGLTLSTAASAYFNPKYLTSDQAGTFGCDPDVNAYSGRLNEICAIGKSSNFRTCGGHVHIGLEGEFTEGDIRTFVKLLDLYLGVPSLLLDKDTERRKLYGKAGAFRHKPYGLEYRTLSNFWMFQPELIGWVWDQVHAAANHYNNRSQFINGFGSKKSMDSIKVRMAINDHDIELAQLLIEDYTLTTKVGELV